MLNSHVIEINRGTQITRLEIKTHDTTGVTAHRGPSYRLTPFSTNLPLSTTDIEENSRQGSKLTVFDYTF